MLDVATPHSSTKSVDYLSDPRSRTVNMVAFSFVTTLVST